jgi:dihydropteroate synthase
MTHNSPLTMVSGLPFDLSAPRVMGILNVTPDSFSDGGRFNSLDRALARAARMVAEGVDILDVGGESTRPGAAAVDLQEEMARVLPVIEHLRAEFDVPISVDTSKPELMRAAVAAGATMINDVAALRAPGAIAAVADAAVPVCLMHMQGEPRTMQTAPQYDDVVADIIQYLDGRVAACMAGGIARERLLIDPGFGFGKTLAHNLALLKYIDRFVATGYRVLVGTSRKRFIGSLTGREEPQGRVFGTAATVALCAAAGVSIVRVHDVAAMHDVVRVTVAIQEG